VTPQRIQRKRTRGWRMPPATVYVGRPTRWGNPFTGPEAVTLFQQRLHDERKLQPDRFEALLAPLRGKHLACWCPLDQPCHAEVLLALANPSYDD